MIATSLVRPIRQAYQSPRLKGEGHDGYPRGERRGSFDFCPEEPVENFTEQLKSADLIPKRNSPVSPASTQESVLAVQMAHWTGMEAIDWNVLDGRANLSVLRASRGLRNSRKSGGC